MKAKLKFDKKAILGFFADNGEKVLFAGVVLGFLFFVYRAVGRERFDKTPENLRTEAENAARHIDQCDRKSRHGRHRPSPLIEAISAPIKVRPVRIRHGPEHPADPAAEHARRAGAVHRRGPASHSGARAFQRS